MSEVRTNSITDAAGTGAPDFPNGIEVSAGNVGIGTATPTQSLEVVGNIQSTVNGTSSILALSGDNTNYSALRLRQSSTVSRLENLIAGTGAYTPIAINAGGSERMRIDTSGHVGIGTTSSSPSALLTIGRYDTVSEGGEINLCRASDNASAWSIDVFGSTSTPSLRFVDTVAAVERMRIASAGQIGIGGANYGTSGQVLTSGGSGAAPSWETPVFSKQYVSSNQTITSAGLLTLAHGLGAVPKSFTFELECATAEAGFSVGDDIVISINSSTAGDNRFTAVYMDATNVYVRYSSTAQVFSYANKATGVALQLTNGSWRFRVRAFA